MSAPKADYYLLGEHFDLSNPIEQEVPPYLPDPLLPAYNLKPHMPHRRRLSAFDNTLGAGPDDASLQPFDLAESIWSQDSDLTLNDLALESDSASNRSHSSSSSRWSAAPLTPLISPHAQLPPACEPVPPPERAPVSVTPIASEPEPEPEVPESPVPAYSRDPLEFDPALLASIDIQLLSRPFEAFEDVCWASFLDSQPAPAVARSLHTRNPSLPQLRPSNRAFAAHTPFSEASMGPSLPLPPPPPPPAYPTSKPLPNLPPPSPRSSAGHAQHDSPPVVMSLDSFVTLEDTSYPTAPQGETFHFYPLRAPARPRSKSVGGTKTARRFAGAIARLRGRE